MRGTIPSRSPDADLANHENRYDDPSPDSPHDSQRFAILGELGRDPVTAEQVRDRVRARLGIEVRIKQVCRVMRLAELDGVAQRLQHAPAIWVETPWE